MAMSSCAPRDRHENVTVLNNLKLEITQKSIRGRRDKEVLVYPYNPCELFDKQLKTTLCMNFTNIK